MSTAPIPERRIPHPTADTLADHLKADHPGLVTLAEHQRAHGDGRAEVDHWHITSVRHFHDAARGRLGRRW